MKTTIQNSNMPATRMALSAIAGLAFMTAWSAVGAGIELPASSGIVSDPFVLTNSYLVQAVTTGATNGGRAAFPFTIDSPGEFVIAAVVDAPAEDANSFYVNVDGEPQEPGMVWDTPVTKGFATNRVSTVESGGSQNRIFHLAAGQHQLIIRGREANTKLVHISILSVPSPPTNLRLLGDL
jgi:hypothetical protein